MPPLHIVYYTDPLCCWSWVFEGVWRRLRWEFGDQLLTRCVMGGLYADTSRYNDPVNDIHNAGQIAPQWLDVASRTGVPLNPRLWTRARPRSSYPPCLAIKAAQRHSNLFADALLRRLREAAMLECRDISRREVLLELVAETRAAFHEDELSMDDFTAALSDETTLRLFRDDLTDVRLRQIGRFPTLLLHGAGDRGLLITGWRPYDIVRRAMQRVAPGLAPLRQPTDLDEYVTDHGRVTIAEIAEAFGWSRGEAHGKLIARGLQAAILDRDVHDASSETTAPRAG